MLTTYIVIKDANAKSYYTGDNDIPWTNDRSYAKKYDTQEDAIADIENQDELPNSNFELIDEVILKTFIKIE